MFSKFWKRLKFNNFVFANLNYFGIFAALKMSPFGLLRFI